MDNEKFAKKLFNFYSYNFYLEKMPLEIYHDENSDVKCAIMQDGDNPDLVMMVSAGASLKRDEPVEAVITFLKSTLKDKEGMILLKELHRKLMKQEYDMDLLNGSILYPSLFLVSEEFTKHFGKVGYALAVRNGGDPVFIDMDDEERVAFVLAPIFLTKEQMNELLNEAEEDEDAFYDYLCELDDEEDCSILK